MKTNLDDASELTETLKLDALGPGSPEKPVGRRFSVSEPRCEAEGQNRPLVGEVDDIALDPITIGAAARILGLSEASTRKWADAGKLGEVVRLVTGDRVLDRVAVEQAARDRGVL